MQPFWLRHFRRPHELTFHERHEKFHGSTTEDVRFVHCFYCDHECSEYKDTCCDCGGGISSTTTYPLRTGPEWHKRDDEIAIHCQPPQASFSRFNDLPSELRIKIWQLALPGSRVVFLEGRRLKWFGCTRVWSDKDDWDVSQSGDLSYCDGENLKKFKRNNYSDWGPGPKDRVGFKSRTPIPGMLCACRESFEVASKVYSKAFGSEYSFPETWFNFQLDILYLDFGLPHGYRYTVDQLGADIQKVKKLALFVAPLHSSRRREGDSETFLGRIVSAFRNIRTVSIVVKRHPFEGSADLILTSQIFDLDRSFKFYSKPYDPESVVDFDKPEMRHPVGTMPDLEILDYLMRSRKLPNNFPKILPGMVITTQKKAAYDRVHKSWVENNSECIMPLEYAMSFNPWDPDQVEFSNSRHNWLDPIRTYISANALVSTIEEMLRRVWEVPEDIKIKMTFWYYVLDSFQTLGSVEGLIPQSRLLQEVPGGPSYFANSVRVEFSRWPPLVM